IPLRLKIVTFVLLAISSYGFWMGLNGVSIRYLLPYFGLVLIHREAMRQRVRFWVFFGLVSALTLANVFVSPEIGLAFVVACPGDGGTVPFRARAALRDVRACRAGSL